MNHDTINFMAWVASKYGETVDPHWVRRNHDALRRAYDENRLAVQASEPEAAGRKFDRYSEI